MNKEELRGDFLQRRKETDKALLTEWSDSITENVLDFVAKQPIKTVMAYAAFRGEVETKGIIERLLKKGITVGLPKCFTKGQMSAFKIENYESLVPGKFGILEPVEQHLLLPEEFDLVLVPGCAFGRDMSRLGYGGGYYDRYLPRCTRAKAVGLGYAFSITDSLPRGEFDVLMDAVITEKGVMNKV